MPNHPRPGLPIGIRALLLANFCHTFAFIGIITFVGDQVFSITGRELDLGLLAVALFVPVFLLAPVGGTVADRVDRRFLFASGVVVHIAVSLGLFFVVRSEPTSTTPFFVLVTIYGIARAFGTPARRALPVDLATPPILSRTIALNSLSHQAGVIAGPVVAGFAAVASPELPYLLGTLFLCVALVLLLLVPDPGTERLASDGGVAKAFADAVDGFRYLRKNRIVLGAIGLDLFAVLLGGATALLPAIAEKRLGVGEVGLGWLRAADGIGAATVSLFLAYATLRRRVGKTLLISVGIFGLATISLGFTTSYAVAFASIFILSAADAVSVHIRASIVPLATPEEMRGRINALENVFIGGSNELGALESGIAAQLLGLTWAIVSGGIGTLVVVGVWWRYFPRLRDVDRMEDVRADTKSAIGPSG